MLLLSLRLKRIKRQRGAALIIALLVVATVVSVVTALAGDFLVSFRRTVNQLDQQQAWNILLASEAVARRVLIEDIRSAGNNRTDSETDAWAVTQLEYPTEHGMIKGSLSDLSGRINLLGLGSKQTKDQRYSPQQQRFIRLLQVLPLDEPMDLIQAQTLAHAVFDWVDQDADERAPGGAENYYYSNAEPAGRTPSTAIGSVSELRWVKGMDETIYRALEPLVSVWPQTSTSININTAPLAVLRSLNRDNDLNPLDEADAELIIDERREQSGLADLTLFTGKRLSVKNIDTSGLTFRSDYFLLSAETEYLSRRFQLNSVLFRNAALKEIKAVARSQGSL